MNIVARVNNGPAKDLFPIDWRILLCCQCVILGMRLRYNVYRLSHVIWLALKQLCITIKTTLHHRQYNSIATEQYSPSFFP